MQQTKNNITFRAFRETGTLILFYPEGRTYSPLAERQAVVVRSARRIRLLRKPTDNEHLLQFAVIVRTDGYFQTAHRLSAKICHRQFYRRYEYRLRDTHFLFAKRNKNREDDDIYWQYTTLKRR